MKINSVILATKKGSKEALALSREVKTWLEEKEILVRRPEEFSEDFTPEQGKPFPDLIIVLGGDGTILSRARSLLNLEIPFLGLNLGQVGFMTEISPDSWRAQLTEIIAGNMMISKRIVLNYELTRGQKIVDKGCAINEVVINRGELARLINVRLDLPGGAKQEVRADGMIFSTPTGSTAYSVSAGGPLVHPEIEVIIITPICPFLHDFKSLVLPCSDTIFASVDQSESESFLTVDGQLGFKLRPGDMIRISRHARDFKVLCTPAQNFISKLVTKRFLKRR